MASFARKNLVSLVLIGAALAGVVAVIATRHKVTTGEQESRERNVLSAYRQEDLTKISLEREGKRIVLERSALDDAGDAVWSLVEPVKEEADAYAIDKLTGSLEYAHWVRRIKPEEVDRAAFGLQSSTWVMKLEMGKINYELRFGKEAAQPAGARYLEVVTTAPGAGVMIIGKDLVAELDLDVGELRGRQLVPYLSSALEKITIEGPAGTRHFKKAGPDRWRFDGMLNDVRVNRDAFDAVLVQFARTKADQFLDLAEAERALAKPPIRLTLTPSKAGDKKAVLEIGGKCPKSADDTVAIRREPDVVAACVPKSVTGGLDTAAETLVDLTLFSLRKDEVESLSIVRGEAKLELDRKEAGFVMRAPVKGDVALEAGNARIDAIVRTSGTLQQGGDRKALGLDPPRGKIVIESAADDDQKVVKETLELGTPGKDGALPVRRLADDKVLLVGREAARVLEADSTLVRSLAILDFSAAEFRTLEVEGKGFQQRFRREPSGGFVLEKPTGFERDAAVISNTIDALRNLTADRWVSDRDDGSFGLGDPRLTARLSYAKGDAGEKNETLTVGALATGGAYAKLASEPGVFLLPRKVLDTLETLAIDRSVFMVTPDNATRVVLERKGKKLVLEKIGDAFSRASGVELSATRVSEIVDTLIAFRPETAVHTGPARANEGLAAPELVAKIESDVGKPRTFRIGAGDAWQGTTVHYARVEGVDATYVIAQSKVRVLLEAF
jgi:hypothetical protein